MEVVYTKLSEQVGQTIKIEKVFPPKFKAWDDMAHKYIESPVPAKGYQKKYNADTDKGRIEFSSSQMAQMLESVADDGRADINGRTFDVKSNGKTGMEIRYFIDAVKEQGEPFEEPLPEGW